MAQIFDKVSIEKEKLLLFNANPALEKRSLLYSLFANKLFMLDRFRVRLVRTEEVPILRNLQTQIGTEFLAVDLPEPEGYELELLEAEKERLALLTAAEESKSDSTSNCENVPPGCELVGDPLKVSFLSLKKLDKMALRVDDTEFELVQTEGLSFDTHLMTMTEACDLIHDLSLGDYFDGELKRLFCVIFADNNASNLALSSSLSLQQLSVTSNYWLRRLHILGFRKADNLRITVKGSYLGLMESAISTMDLHCVDMRVFPLRKIYFKSHFDVLKDALLLKRADDYVPASFTIQAEWQLSVDRQHLKTNYLEMPPDNATATVRFKPGWMDSRVVLSDRIHELKYLSSLASSLKAGLIPWKEETVDEAFILERVTQLVNGAKCKLDPDTVQPFDFTDRFWDILKTSHSVETLKQAFQMIYDELQTGDFRVLVETSKVSSIAKMLRIRNPAEIIFPRLESMTCLQLLVEMGIDRFNGDLTHRFLSRHFLPNNLDLMPFFLPFSAQIETRISRLTTIYFALQSMVMIDDCVQFAPHERTNMTKRLLDFYISNANEHLNPDAFNREFEFTVSIEDIRRERINNKLSEWLVEREYNWATTTALLLKSGTENENVHCFHFHLQKSALNMKRNMNEIKNEPQ